MVTKYSARHVANALLYKAGTVGAKMTHMKLQKLVFFVHAWSLAFSNQSVVSERPQAWPYGPVFDSLYHDLKGFGSNSIDSYASELDPTTGQIQPRMPSLDDKGFWQLVDRVWERYGAFSAVQLSALTHEHGSPWETSRAAKAGQMDDELIGSYYREKLSSNV